MIVLIITHLSCFGSPFLFPGGLVSLLHAEWSNLQDWSTLKNGKLCLGDDLVTEEKSGKIDKPMKGNGRFQISF